SPFVVWNFDSTRRPRHPFVERRGYQISGMVDSLPLEIAALKDVCIAPVNDIHNDRIQGIDYANLDYGASLHFATVGSNNGHDGPDGRAFFNDPEVINDFAYRAIHVETVIGKHIVDAYYGTPHQRSYFFGCSSGGRQGTQAALKYPEDFDGIVAGAPATDWNHLTGWETMMARYVGAPNASTSPSFIAPSLWNAIAAEILEQCDALDGVKDGIITEPDDCHFRPDSIRCRGNTVENCLTVPQLEALRKIYRPIKDAEGHLLYPRYDPGAEADGNAQRVLGGSIIASVCALFVHRSCHTHLLHRTGFGIQSSMTRPTISTTFRWTMLY
ncbi:hypothetical protein H0H87_001784, partial [Tephrocybe sp. NHM501043]